MTACKVSPNLSTSPPDHMNIDTENKKPTYAEIIEALKAIAQSEQYKAKYAKFLPNGHPVQSNKPRCA